MQGDVTDSGSSAPVDTTSSIPSPAAETSTPSSEAPSRVSENTGDSSKESLLDAVLKVAPTTPEDDVLGEPKTEESPTTEETQPESEVKAEDSSEDSEESQEDDEQVPDSVPAQTRKKINKLLRERRELRDEVSTLRPVAEIGQQLQSYAQTNNLSADDVVFALDLAAMVSRGDYTGFYEVISPLVRHAQEVTGVVLPPDIQQMVDQQQITPAAARQFATTRFEQIRAENQNRQMQERQQTQQVQHVVGDVQRSVTAFEQRIMASDPDYKAKAEMVRRTAQAMLAEYGGRISSSQEAVEITQRAYDEVNKQFRRMQPVARPTAPTPGVSQAQTPTARPAPKNLMEAALQGLAKTRAGRL